MRRMRSGWQYFLFAIPIVTVAFGVMYVTKRQTVMKALVAAQGKQDLALGNLKMKLKHDWAKLEKDEDTPDQDLKEGSVHLASIPGQADATRAPASANECQSEEFPGAGLRRAPISQADWAAVMNEFHDSKILLSNWLKAHEKQFQPKTYQWMSNRIAQAELQRPPSADEPDLAWRGIGVVARVQGDTPLIRVGGGFAKWVKANPWRARFELTRLLAQTWSPCQIGDKAPAAWNEYLSCMNVENEFTNAKACASGTYSEAGWAVSTAIASVVSPPGCRVPAFDGASGASCLKKMGVSL